MKPLEQIVVVGRRRGLADTSIDAYSSWIRNYLAFSAQRHGSWKSPQQLFTEDVETFLNHLVMERRLSAVSQNQALNALVFLYKQVLADCVQSSLDRLACA
jgi:site-specific recombinase XerD